MSALIAVLAGDGIGAEVVAEAVKVVEVLNQHYGADLRVESALIGGDAYEQTGTPLPAETFALAERADAILLGAVGGPRWENIERALRPERALLQLREKLDLFSNLRPAMLFPELAAASSLKPDIVSGLDIVIVRELTSGIYFGEPRGIGVNDAGERYGYNTLTYTESEIRRIAHSAFQTAHKRRQRLCSVDKANVLEVSELWREVVTDVGNDYQDVSLSHMYVDNAAMQLVRDPRQFDVIVTTNMFGDILSDCASMLTGSIGMLPSASLNGSGKGMYEPVHGSAPDIAGQQKANPLAAILSLAMMMTHSLNLPEHAARIDKAVRSVLADGLRTADIAGTDERVVSTAQMGDAVTAAMQA